MADPLPVMPSLGVNQNPQVPVAPGALSAVGRFLTQPFTTPAPAPAAAATPAPVAQPAGGTNPYAPGGVIPPSATPAAIAAFRAGVERDMAQAQPAALAGQAAPNVVRGGVPEAGGGGPISFRQLGAIAPLIPPVRTAGERASHELMDTYGQMHQADIDVAKATAAGNPAAIAEATARQAFLKSPQTAKHIMNLKSIGLPSFGTLNAETAAAQQQ